MIYKPPYTIPEVLRLKADGQTHAQIANHFGISRSRVGQLVKREKERAASAERAERLRQQIRDGLTLSDLDEKLPVDDVLCLIELPPSVCKRFKRAFLREGRGELSLRQFMEILLPLVDNPKNFYEVLPAFKISSIGTESYAAATTQLSSLDLGEVFKKEWGARVRRLAEYLTASEGYRKSKSLLYRFGMMTPSPPQPSPSE